MAIEPITKFIPCFYNGSDLPGKQNWQSIVSNRQNALSSRDKSTADRLENIKAEAELLNRPLIDRIKNAAALLLASSGAYEQLVGMVDSLWRPLVKDQTKITIAPITKKLSINQGQFAPFNNYHLPFKKPSDEAEARVLWYEVQIGWGARYNFKDLHVIEGGWSSYPKDEHGFGMPDHYFPRREEVLPGYTDTGIELAVRIPQYDKPHALAGYGKFIRDSYYFDPFVGITTQGSLFQTLKNILTYESEYGASHYDIGTKPGKWTLNRTNIPIDFPFREGALSQNTIDTYLATFYEGVTIGLADDYLYRQEHNALPGKNL